MSETQNSTYTDDFNRVSRKLGVCVIRMQQYELLVKGLLSKSCLSGSITDFQNNQEIRKADMRRKTLGQLVGELTGNFLRNSTSPPREETLIQTAGTEITAPHMSFNFFVEMDDQDFDSFSSELAALVDTRNDLIHHFLERFNLFDASVLPEAEAYLDQTYKSVDRHFVTLREWAKAFEKGRKVLFQELQSKPFGS